MDYSDNPFHNPSKARKLKDILVKGVLLIATYTILIFTLSIFGLVIKRGAPVLAQYGLDFVKKNPESLEVVSFNAAEKLQISSASFGTLLTYNPQDGLFTDVEDIKKSKEYRRFTLEPGGIIGDGYLANIEGYNDYTAKYLKRDVDTVVGLEYPKDTIYVLKPEVYQEVIQKSDLIKALPHDTLNLKKKSYLVEVKAQEGVLQAKTISKLVSSPLIYKLYGSLSDAEDTPGAKIPLLIPKDQVVSLTPAQYSAYKEDSGTIKSEPAQEVVEDYQLIKIKLAKGRHQLPISVLTTLQNETPVAPSVTHSHNLEKGAIHLDLKKAKPGLILPAESYESMILDNPSLKVSGVSSFTHETDFKQFTLTKAVELKLPQQTMADLRASTGTEFNLPRLKALEEKPFPYSAGGIAGPILGTAALVTACMLIALAIGVCAAVFLGEYSRKGKLLTTIRLSMMNLAGVPSIVFGIFGLGLFVSIAPKLTTTPAINDKVKIPVFVSLKTPDLRTQEKQKIVIIDKDKDLDGQLVAAKQKSLQRFYTGKTYLSFQGWGNSLIAGAFTLAIMVLPIIITASEESLRAVPKGFREASLALGATKWQSIRTAVLPYATPGILTASVLGITRVAGETAPIMFTAAVASKSDLPTNLSALPGVGLEKFFSFLSQSVQAMPYHIYTTSGKLPPSHYIEPMQYGSVLVFMIIVMSFAGLSVALRIRMRKKYKW